MELLRGPGMLKFLPEHGMIDYDTIKIYRRILQAMDTYVWN
jgi:hypothetical protein